MTKSLQAPAILWLAIALGTTMLSGCAQRIEHRGYIAKPGAFNQVSNGMSKTEVEAALGSPSTTASVNYQGDSYYYISSTTEGRAFFTPKETSREVIAVRFDKGDQVQSFAQYGLEDGRIINVNSRTTPVAGDDLSMLKRLFAGLLNPSVGPGGPMLGRKVGP